MTQSNASPAKRIAVGGFLHESHSFAPLPTRYADFLHPGGFPPLSAGPALLDAVRTTSVALAGALEAADAAAVETVPLTWCFANPAGPVEDEAFERIAALLVAALADALDAGPLDGLYLDLHGAAVATSFPDAEGELLRRVRAVTGPALPLTVSLDPHANLTARMVAAVDAAVPYRTYPHVDMRAAGAGAMRLLLARIERGRPWARAFRQLDFWTPLPAQCTLVEPMAGVLAERARLAEAPALAELAFCFGFPYADFADCGMAVAAFADTAPTAAEAADALVAFLHAREPAFALSIPGAREAVANAIGIAAQSPGRPVVLADTQDNPGGGGHGDTTGLLRELVDQHAEGAVLALINDADSAAQCHRAGEGARLHLSLGGKSDNVPLDADATVLRLTDGAFTNTGPMGRGNPSRLGPCALIDIAGVRVVVVSRKTQAYDQALLRHFGIEPAECRILALKSSVHFRADFGPIAESRHRRRRPRPCGRRPGRAALPPRPSVRPHAAHGERMTAFCWFATFRTLPRPPSPEHLRATPGLQTLLLHTPSTTSDPYLHDGTPPPLVLQAYFPTLEAMEAALAPGGHLAALPDLTGGDATHQAMAVRTFPVPDPAIRTAPGQPHCTYLVAYEGEAESLNAWLTHYIASHPPIMARFPGIRAIEIFTRIDWIDALPWPRAAAMQRNKVVFDSPDALTAALNSPVRHEMREDFHRFPPFTGNNTHYPMLTRTLAEPAPGEARR